MAWWDEVLGLLKDEWKALGPGSDGSALEPPTVKQAQALLERTSRELADAKARAEAARRRMLRAQAQFEALTRDPDQHQRFRDRLSELASAVAHEGDMVASFDTHIATLTAVHDRIDAQLRAFNRDVAMARSVLAASQATQAAAPGSAPRKRKGAESGFEHARSGKVMDRLRRGPRKGGEG